MVDPTRLRSILDRVYADVFRLEELGETGDLDAVKYRMLTAVEGLVSAGRHVIASLSLPGADTYADTFAVLEHAGHLTSDQSQRGQQMARFQNLLAHGYAAVDNDRVRMIARSSLGDITALADAIAATAGPADTDR